MHKLSIDPKTSNADLEERNARIRYYQSWNKDRILNMTQDDLLEYLSKPWAMIIWSNKRYFVDKLIEDNGFSKIKNELAELIWGEEPIEIRWNHAFKNIKGFGWSCYIVSNAKVLLMCVLVFLEILSKRKKLRKKDWRKNIK